MTATTTCACGAPLTELVEQWIGSCYECAVPSSLQVPLSPAMRLAVSGAATEALMRRTTGDTSQRWADHCRHEANADCIDALTPVQCSECPRVYRLDDVPNGPFICPECTGDLAVDEWD